MTSTNGSTVVTAIPYNEDTHDRDEVEMDGLYDSQDGAVDAALAKLPKVSRKTHFFVVRFNVPGMNY